jgi:hypothetical protein
VYLGDRSRPTGWRPGGLEQEATGASWNAPLAESLRYFDRAGGRVATKSRLGALTRCTLTTLEREGGPPTAQQPSLRERLRACEEGRVPQDGGLYLDHDRREGAASEVLLADGVVAGG